MSHTVDEAIDRAASLIEEIEGDFIDGDLQAVMDNALRLIAVAVGLHGVAARLDERDFIGVQQQPKDTPK